MEASKGAVDMKIEILNLPEEGIRLADRRDAQIFAGIKEMMTTDGIEFPTPIEVDLHIWPERDMIKVKGQIGFSVRQACSRCLAVFESPLNQEFTLRFSRQIPQDVHSADGKEEIELTADQIGLVFFEGDLIDLTDAIQEQIILAMPFKPLCREDCKGLCHRCGNDLNLSACGCAATQPSGPFDILMTLRPKLGKG
jgi:uncharacterized protein